MRNYHHVQLSSDLFPNFPMLCHNFVIYNVPIIFFRLLTLGQQITITMRQSVPCVMQTGPRTSRIKLVSMNILKTLSSGNSKKKLKCLNNNLKMVEVKKTTVEHFNIAAWKKCDPETSALIAHYIKKMRPWPSKMFGIRISTLNGCNIATTNYCDPQKGRKGRICFTLAIFSCFTVYLIPCKNAALVRTD